MDFAPSGWGIEPWGGSGGGGGGSGTPPFVTNVSPAPGTTLSPADAVEFDVLDVDSAIRRIVVLVRYPHVTTVEAAYEVPGLTPQFALSSTVTAITNGFHFKLVRAGGWPDTSFTIVVDAVDVTGLEN